jgi:K+-transporting ATPase ATPase A chain
MTLNGMLQLLLYMVVLLALAKPLGRYMARVYEGQPTALDRVFGPLERLIYRLCGVRAGRPEAEMGWKTYAFAMMLFNLLGLFAVYALQRFQGLLPLNPQDLSAVTSDSSFNTAVSFATNTNWQGYGGETTMSYLVQMLGLTVQNFVSAAAGMATLAAFIRGLSRHTAQTIGNFWVDLTRSTLYILLPLSLVLALIQVSQGVVQNFNAYQTVPLLQSTSYEEPRLDAAGKPLKDADGKPVTETREVKEQVLPMGPAASQIAIKQLGTNGGGFFNVNSSHPFENATPLSNFFEVLAILVISAALCYTFGVMVGDTRQGWAVLAAMTLIFVPLLALCVGAEQSGNPAFTRLGIDQTASDMQAGGNMEGKEVRFGIANSALWATATTAASNGSVNSMHDSFTPLSGLVPMFLMQLGEVIYGGVGSGLYGMLVFAIIAVFVAGLMVGRTPEYLGKKIESYEMKMASLVILIPPLLVLVFTALAVATEAGKATVFNPGAHGFSEVLYAFSSMGNNNGSAFAGL